MGRKEKKLSLDLPERTAKPREYGISNLVDNGYGLSYIEDVLSFCHPYIDIAKLGWASAYVTSNLREKIILYKKYGLRVHLGGMMFEICWNQGKIEEYHLFMQDHGIDMVEVSNGSLPIPEGEKVKMIEYFTGRGYTVLSEVGSKDVNVQTPPKEWIRCIRNDIDAGAWKVIMEGRADASAGIYHGNGTVKDELIEAVIDSGIPLDMLIFEAPHKYQVAYFVNRIGANVNIGNIPLEEALNVETLRRGLRGDTVLKFETARTALHGRRPRVR